MRCMLRENSALSPTARTLWEIQDRLCRLPVETATNIYTDVLRRREQAAAAGQARREAVHDQDSMHAFQQETRELFLRCIGGLPATPPDCLPRLMGREDHGAFTLEKILPCIECG